LKTRTFARPVIIREMRIAARLASLAEVVNPQYGRPKRRVNFAAHPAGVLGRQHRGRAPLQLPGHGRRHGGRPVTTHRAGVAQAEVDVFESVHAGQMRPARGSAVQREASGQRRIQCEGAP